MKKGMLNLNEQSDNGHFVETEKDNTEIKKGVTLKSKNHGTIEFQDVEIDGGVVQTLYNPFSETYFKALD